MYEKFNLLKEMIVKNSDIKVSGVYTGAGVYGNKDYSYTIYDFETDEITVEKLYKDDDYYEVFIITPNSTIFEFTNDIGMLGEISRDIDELLKA